ncbi:MAG: L-threonylcarbamoyladenylate synthase [Paracoccaceae bacterium]|jgi:L-threonylcarbamoyladenylate synthase|nr:L-threonylcarbamoyladenylate synthase [Paracoccaceae bacterium]
MLTELLKADQKGLLRASDLIRNGQQVAFPTETVYGLGADARNDLAVAGIFKSKDRPKFNPLIIHFSDLALVEEYVNLNNFALKLAEAFWPGPLTLVCRLKKYTDLSSLATSGLGTVGVRIPSNKIALDFIKLCGIPIAAPSANRSGKISATNSSDVINELGSIIPAVIDGGKSKIGLESTIIDVSDSVPILLRPGGLIIEDIQTVLGTITLKNQKKVLNSPGQLESHYAPETKMRLNASNKRNNEVLLGFGVFEADLNLSVKGDLTEAASNLFSQMRLIDNLAKKIGADCIAVSPIPQIGLGLALNDRLQRAAFRN